MCGTVKREWGEGRGNCDDCGVPSFAHSRILLSSLDVSIFDRGFRAS